MACMDREKQQASKHSKAIDEYEAEIKALREKLEQASVDAINSSEKVAIAAEQSAKHALDSTRAILASLGGDVSETEKKADSLGE